MDGNEFESTANFFDLRYLPNDMTIDTEPTDSTSQSPVAYEPSEFVTQALQHSSVKLTWDAEDPERQKVTRRAFSKEDLEKMDFKAYLASSDSSDAESEADEETRKKYQALMESVRQEEDENAGKEMEITFTPGLSEKAERLLQERVQKEVGYCEIPF